MTAQEQGDQEVREVAIKFSAAPPPIVYCATHYLLNLRDHGLHAAFVASSPLHIQSSGVAVWCPREALDQEFIRERDRLRPVMRLWGGKSVGQLPSIGAEAVSNLVATNFVNVAVGSLGASMTFFWVPPSKFAAKQGKIEADPVLEVRLPSQICAKFWLEIDTHMAAQASDEGAAPPDKEGE